MKRPVLVALAFAAGALLIEIAAVVLVSRFKLSLALLNIWPLSVGMIGFVYIAVTAPEERKRALGLFGLAAAALTLEWLRDAWPAATALCQAGLVGLLLAALVMMARRPVARAGALLGREDVRWIGLGLLFGLVPTAGPYLVLRLMGHEALSSNAAWHWADHPFAGAGHMALAGAALLLNTLVGEEAGWRGWLATRLRGQWSQRRFVWGTALLFAMWHVPFDIVISHMDGVNLVINQATRVLAGAAYLRFFVAGGGRLPGVCAFHAMHNFVVYELIGPKAPFAPVLHGMEGLAAAGLYILLMGVIAWISGRLARGEMPGWVRGPMGTEEGVAEQVAIQ